MKNHCVRAAAVLGLCAWASASAQEAPAGATPVRCSSTAAQLEQAQRYLTEINLVRTEPARYADTLERAMASMDAGGTFLRDGYRIRTQEGRGAVDEALAALRRQRPVVALNLNGCLSQAAQRHAQYLGRTGAVGHTGAGGSNPTQRATQAFGDRVSCGETVSAGPGSARDHVMALLIDDGVPDRGHRQALLDPGYRTLGVGQAAHPIGSVSVQLLCHQVLPP